MENPSTYDDVNLILRLYELRREEKMRAARDYFYSNYAPKSMEDAMQLAPPGSPENAYVRMVVSYWEMVASFITSGVLNEELFFQSGGEMLLVWQRLLPIVPGVRAAFKNPGLYKNLEAVGQRYIEWMKRQSPEAYAMFAEHVAKAPGKQT